MSLNKLEQAQNLARENYEAAQKILQESKENPATFPIAAQQANDAWLAFKDANLKLSNYSTIKKLGDLYGV